jgi:hypothetical protein
VLVASNMDTLVTYSSCSVAKLICMDIRIHILHPQQCVLEARSVQMALVVTELVVGGHWAASNFCLELELTYWREGGPCGIENMAI